MRLGKRHLELATKWIPTALTYGATGGCLLVYFTDWKVIAANIPFYSGKFEE